MKTIEIFSSLGEHFFEDKTVRKYGEILVKTGVKGLKEINPVALWLDAGLSVLEATDSYLNYAKEQEITKQLEKENESFKKELGALVIKLKLHNIEGFEKGNAKVMELNRQLTGSSLYKNELINSIQSELIKTKRMLQIVKKERENAVNFEKLQILQINLDNFIRASLMCLLCTVDDTEAMVSQ